MWNRPESDRYTNLSGYRACIDIRHTGFPLSIGLAIGIGEGHRRGKGLPEESLRVDELLAFESPQYDNQVLSLYQTTRFGVEIRKSVPPKR